MELDLRIDGRTKLTGLIGNPWHILFHRSSITVFFMPGHKRDICSAENGEAELADEVKGLAALGFAGFNVTIPYKEAICALLDEADKEVRLLGTANTVKIKTAGCMVQHGWHRFCCGI